MRAKALSRAGYRVVIYDNLIAGHREAVRYGPLVEGDIADLAAVRAALRQHEIFAVMHFAAFLDVGESVRDPGRYYRNNVIGALSCPRGDGGRIGDILRACRRPARSTASRGRRRSPKRIPQQPINSYGETKLAVERALPHFDRAHGMRWVALRYFNAAGADPDGEIGEDHAPEIHLIPRAIEAATGGRGLQVFGDDYPTPDGTCLRDYIHVADLADAHVRALDVMVETGQSGAYNLGTGEPHSVREVIDTVERVTGRRVPVDARRRAGRAIRLCSMRPPNEGAGRAGLDAAIPRSGVDRPHRVGLAPKSSARLRFGNDARARRGAAPWWIRCCRW